MSPWLGLELALLGIGAFIAAGVLYPTKGLSLIVRGIGGTFVLQILYAATLVLLLEIYATDPKSLPFPKVVAGVPLGVPWFGALGALGVSLSALSSHRHDWDIEWWYWHASRPLMGAVAGSISVLVFIAGILAVQQNPQTGSPIATTKILYYVIAFVVGYREASFRELLNNVTDIILRSSGARQPTSVTGTAPDSGPAGTEVTIYGSGLAAVNSVTFDGNDATIKSAADAKLLVVAPAHNDGEVPLVVRTRDASFGGYKFVYTPAPVNARA